MSTSSQPWERRFVRYVLCLFVLMSCVRVWIGPISWVDTAQAQIPDSGQQRKQLLDETRRTNQLLLEIKQILKSGPLNVRLLDSDNTHADN